MNIKPRQQTAMEMRLLDFHTQSLHDSLTVIGESVVTDYFVALQKIHRTDLNEVSLNSPKELSSSITIKTANSSINYVLIFYS